MVSWPSYSYFLFRNEKCKALTISIIFLWTKLARNHNNTNTNNNNSNNNNVLYLQDSRISIRKVVYFVVLRFYIQQLCTETDRKYNTCILRNKYTKYKIKYVP